MKYLIPALIAIAFAVDQLFGVQCETIKAIPGLAMMGISLGASLIGDLLKSKGGGTNLPQWYIDSLRGQLNADPNRFVPDQQAFTAQTQSEIDDILAKMPISREKFNADLASRGIYSSGEAPREMYEQVYGPITRAATSAVTAGQVGYEQIKQQGLIAGERQKAQIAQILGGYGGAWDKQPSFMSSAGDTLGGLGSFGLQYGILQKLGLFG